VCTSSERDQFCRDTAAMPDDTFSAALVEFFSLGQMPNDGADLTKVEKLAAAFDSANYLNTHMTGVQRFEHSTHLLTAGMWQRTIPGLVLEFGVYSGTTINHLASIEPATIFGFDSFEGLPEDWRSDLKKGTFRTEKLPTVLPNVDLIVGWFEDVLPTFLASHPEPVSFLHVDCDLYSSTKTIFYYLKDRIRPGTVIVFDEYFNYVGWRNHEFKAFAEFISASGYYYRYFGAVAKHQQVGVIIV
jgi:hypothetical protein